jgi:hypothetical protein
MSPGITNNSKTPFRLVGPTEPKELTENCRETKEVSKGEIKLRGPRKDHGASGKDGIEISTPKGIEMTG